MGRNKGLRKGALARSLRRTPVQLALLYALFVAVRFISALVCSPRPLVVPDELVYTEIARSLWQNGTVAMCGYPIAYDSLLYPLLLSPLYALPDTVYVYRFIQLLNALLVNLSLFPVFALAKRVTGDEKKAKFAVFFVLLMPDMILSQMALNETICYPLAFAALYEGYLALGQGRKTRHALLCALLGVLLYFAKPGYIAVVAALVIVLVFVGIKNRTPKDLLSAALAGALTAAGVFSLSALCKSVFGAELWESTYYQAQIPALSLRTAGRALTFSTLYAYYFPVVCGVLPFVAVTGCGRALKPENKRLAALVLCGFVLTALGTSYTVNLSEMGADALIERVHMRYLTVYVAMIVLLCMAPELQNKKGTWLTYVFLGLLLAGAALLPYTVFGKGVSIDAPMLAALYADQVASPTRFMLQIGMYLLLPLSAFLLARFGWTKAVRTLALTLCVAVLTVNNGVMLTRFRNGSALNGIYEDSLEVKQSVDRGDMVLVSDNKDARLPGLLTAMRRDVYIVRLVDLLRSLDGNNAYTPFKPSAVFRYIVDHELPQVNQLVFTSTSLTLAEFTSQDGVKLTTNGMFIVVPVKQNQPFLRSVFSAHNRGIFEGHGDLTICDRALMQSGGVRVRIEAMASRVVGKETTMTVEARGGTQTFALSGEEYRWYDIDVPLVGDEARELISFSTDNIQFSIRAYETMPIPDTPNIGDAGADDADADDKGADATDENGTGNAAPNNNAVNDDAVNDDAVNDNTPNDAAPNNNTPNDDTVSTVAE